MEGVSPVLKPQGIKPEAVFNFGDDTRAPGNIAEARTLYLNHFGPHLRRQSRGKGLGDDGPGGQDAHPLERTELLRKKRLRSARHLDDPLFSESQDLGG